MADWIVEVAGSEVASELSAIAYEAIHEGPSAYTTEQRRAWLPEPWSGEVWQQRLAQQTVVVARQGDSLAGFVTLRNDGYIDLAYIRPRWQGQGLFRRLLTFIESQARLQALPRLWVHASLNAYRPFMACGFQILETEIVAVRGEQLERKLMDKTLNS